MALFAIGDVHGCARTLDALLARLAPTPADHLVFVGDYIDRGPDVRGVLTRLLELEAEAAAGRGPRCTFLRGNHDQMMLDFVDGRPEAADLWRINGGLATMAAYAAEDGVAIPDAHLAFLRRTALYHDTPEFLFVHAGLKPHQSVAENLRTGTARTFLWERAHLDAARLAWEKAVVCGHTPMHEPLNLPQLVAIDTGAVYAHVHGLGRLTAVQLPERAFTSVPFEG